MMSHGPWKRNDWKYIPLDARQLGQSNFRIPYALLCLLTVIFVLVSLLYLNFNSLGQQRLLPFQLNISCVQNGQDEHDNSTSARTFMWNDTRLDILHMEQFEFDTRFKNPCWFETLRSPDPYQRNVYSSYSPAVKRMLEKMTSSWRERLSRKVSPYRLRCLPYFYIIGQPKCGSTDLFWRISRHPDVVTPPIKELHWWSRGRQGRRVNYSDIIPLEDYIDMFDKVAFLIESQNFSRGYTSRPFPLITGEASVSLFWDNPDWYNYPENQNLLEPRYTNPDYIHHLLPDVKLILIVRNPSDRLYSDYLYFHRTNKSAEDFHNAVVQATHLYSNCSRMRSVRECVYDVQLAIKAKVRLRLGLYSVYLDDWLRVFSEDQILILRLEDYAIYPKHTMDQIFKFLKLRGLSSDEKNYVLKKPIENQRSTSNRQVGNMLPETRQLLDQYFSPFNRHFAELMNDQRFLWKEHR